MNKVNNFQIEIEAIDPADLEEQKQVLEMQELRRVESRIKKVEVEKLRLLNKEYRSENRLTYKSGQHALTLHELEQRYDFK